MDLSEILGNGVLNTSDLDGMQFGHSKQLTVLGWSGKSNYDKLYIVRCEICKHDSEMFGEGIFKSIKSNLVRCNLPCGCSSNPKFTENQNRIIVQRWATDKGFVFKGWVGQYKGSNTKIHLVCPRHGDWKSSRISGIRNKKCCPKCRDFIKNEENKLSDQEMISRFVESKAFSEDSIFIRSPRATLGNPFGRFWYVFCPECGEINESDAYRLAQGQVPCSCSMEMSRICYINLVIDNGIVVAIKFGRTSKSGKIRSAVISRKSVYTIENYADWVFETYERCVAAERKVKEILPSGYVLKRDLPQGFSETLSPIHIEKVIEIYESFGGKRNE